MACKPIMFPGITRDKFEEIRCRLVDQAIGHASLEIVGDTGTASGSGVKVQWTYSEAQQQLTLQCISKPFIVPEGVIASKLRDFVEAQ